MAYLDHLATETPGQTVEYKLKSALEAVDLHVTGHQGIAITRSGEREAINLVGESD